jgi:type IX secretion system PorP/SprF family membrane protein
LLLDGKLTGREPETNTLGASLGMLTDQSLNGAFSSTYVSGSLAYHLQLAPKHRFGLGMTASYGQRRLDYAELSFGEQFTSGGFDVVGLPSGETALASMKPYMTVGAGLRYEYRTQQLRMDIGGAVYHVNKPKQSFLSDPQQVVPMRYVGQFNLDNNINERLLLSTAISYQQQATQSYFSLGGALGMDVSNGDRSHVLFVGSWYRQADALYPFVAVQFGQAQIGLSYDVTLSKQNQQLTDPRSFELSLVLRQKMPQSGVTICPPNR